LAPGEGFEPPPPDCLVRRRVRVTFASLSLMGYSLTLRLRLTLSLSLAHTVKTVYFTPR